MKSTSTTFREVALGDKALKYMQEQLSTGGSASRDFSAQLAHGRISCLLPNSFDDHSPCNFSSGGIFTPSERKQQRSILLNNIYDYLWEDSDHIVLMDEHLLRIDDPILRYKDNIITFNRDIYTYLLPGETRQHIQEAFTMTHGYPMIIIYAVCKRGIRTVDNKSVHNVLTNIRKSVERVVVGVYDEEAFLYWKAAEVCS